MDHWSTGFWPPFVVDSFGFSTGLCPWWVCEIWLLYMIDWTNGVCAPAIQRCRASNSSFNFSVNFPGLLFGGSLYFANFCSSSHVVICCLCFVGLAWGRFIFLWLSFAFRLALGFISFHGIRAGLQSWGMGRSQIEPPLKCCPSQNRTPSELW